MFTHLMGNSALRRAWPFRVFGVFRGFICSLWVHLLKTSGGGSTALSRVGLELTISYHEIREIHRIGTTCEELDVHAFDGQFSVRRCRPFRVFGVFRGFICSLWVHLLKTSGGGSAALSRVGLELTISYHEIREIHRIGTTCEELDVHAFDGQFSVDVPAISCLWCLSWFHLLSLGSFVQHERGRFDGAIVGFPNLPPEDDLVDGVRLDLEPLPIAFSRLRDDKPVPGAPGSCPG